VPPEPPARAEALNGAGAHDLGAAGGWFHGERPALWRELGDPADQASALNNLKNQAVSQREGNAAGAWYEEAAPDRMVHGRASILTSPPSITSMNR
jgi:hypothetical protein